MSRRVVLIPVIPGELQRGSAIRSDLDYAPYGIATWRFWCSRQNVELRLIDQPQLEQEHDRELAPTIQRWIAARRILAADGPDTRLAIVDADTMVRWDTPDLFALAGGGFAAVRDWGGLWIHRSIQAYQHLFPDVSLPWWDYINAGVVVVNARHLPVIDALIDFSRRRWSELSSIQKSGNYGTDQTILNFIVKELGQEVTFLPPPFNCLHCFPMDHELMRLERAVPSSCSEFAALAFSRPDTFDFVDMAYIWHFTNVITCRRAVMEETWRRVCQHYSSVDVAVSQPAQEHI